jgi:hypothetical protein
VAQDHVELLGSESLDRALTGAFNQAGAAPYGIGFCTWALFGLSQHRRRRVENSHLEAQPGQWKRLVVSAAAYVEQRSRRLAYVCEQVLMKNMGTDLAIDRGIRALDERGGKRCPRIIGRVSDHLTQAIAPATFGSPLATVRDNHG